MLKYDKTDISKGIDINKTNASKECDICHYWYFLDKNFNYEPHLCNGCHDLMQKAMNFNDLAIVSIKGNDYRIHFWYMSKVDAISIMNNSSLNEKTDHYKIFSHYIQKMSVTTYYQRNREVMLNRANEYYKNNKEVLRERAKNKYRELSSDIFRWVFWIDDKAND